MNLGLSLICDLLRSGSIISFPEFSWRILDSCVYLKHIFSTVFGSFDCHFLFVISDWAKTISVD